MQIDPSTPTKTQAQFIEIYGRVLKRHGLDLPDDTLTRLLMALVSDMAIAAVADAAEHPDGPKDRAAPNLRVV